MKARWERIMSRMNAMTLRERFLLFAVVVVVLGVLTNELFIAPLTRLQGQRAEQIDKSSAAMEVLRSRIEAELAERRRGRVAELGAEIGRVQDELDAVEREIAALSGASSDTAALKAVLTRVLGRTDKVALVRVTTSAPGSAQPAGAGAASGGGLDITLGGGYLDLMEYLASLEVALPQARWSALRFTAETAPAQVTVRIVTTRGGP